MAPEQQTASNSISRWLGMLQVHHIVRLFLAVQADSRVPWSLKLFAWAGLIYIFSPLDVMPEMFTGIGLLDDIIVSIIIMQGMLELAPRRVLEEHSSRLGINLDAVFISVPQTVREARSLYAFVQGLQGSLREWDDASQADEGAARMEHTDPISGAVTAEAAERGVAAGGPARYSAHRRPGG